MTVPVAITTALASLQAQVDAAAPLANATISTKTALQLNAAALVLQVQSALVAPNNFLDVWVAPIDALSIIAGIGNALSVSQDQNALALMRGVVGRATSNLDQL